jgi:hypothetical protein
MAIPTTPNHTPAPAQHPTPHVGQQGTQPVAATTGEPAMPMLFEDIDPVLLVRLYPEAADDTAMRAQAMAAGMAARTEGMALVASQQEPVLIEGQPLPAPTARPTAGQHPAAPPH